MPIRFEFSEQIEQKLLKQLDFALVRTYTKAAQVAQQAVRDSLPQRFQLRRRAFISNSIRVEAATKEHPVATVFVPTDGPYNADFLVRQELGGTKLPTRGHKHLALPPPFVEGARRVIVKQGKRPSDLLKIATHTSLKTRKVIQGFFKIDESTPNRYRHGLHPGIYQRGGAGKGNKGKRKLKTMFLFERQGHMDARFRFRETAMRAAQQAMPGIFAASLDEALRTAR